MANAYTVDDLLDFLDHAWDKVLLVLLDIDLEALVIYEASRAKVRAALEAPGSRARNERGALAISKFKAISRVVWQRTRIAAA